MAYRMKPRSEMSQEKLDLEAKEQEEFNNGPLSVLNHSVRNNAQVLINCCNNKNLFGRIKAFHSHCNMVLENVKEIWTEKPKNRGKAKKNTKPVNRERFIPKLFVRGDSIIMVVKNPVITISDD